MRVSPVMVATSTPPSDAAVSHPLGTLDWPARTERLLDESDAFSSLINEWRLALEVNVRALIVVDDDCCRALRGRLMTQNVPETFRADREHDQLHVAFALDLEAQRMAVNADGLDARVERERRRKGDCGRLDCSSARSLLCVEKNFHRAARAREVEVESRCTGVDTVNVNRMPVGWQLRSEAE